MSTLDRAQDPHEVHLRSLVATAGLPRVWAMALHAAAPAVAVAARELVQALEPDSDGGRRATTEELKAIARKASRAFERALLEELGE